MQSFLILISIELCPLYSCEWNRDLNDDQLIRVKEMREWVEAEAGLQGRTDDDYLLMFLRSCEFDLELTRKTLRMYCENRTKYPQWCSNRDLNQPDLKQILQTKFATALIDQNPQNPTIIISNLSRYENQSDHLDAINKAYGVMLETIARRRNCQVNGFVALTDLKDAPWWLTTKILSVSYINAISQAFVLGVPVRTVALVLINAPAIAGLLLKLCQPIIPAHFKNKIFCVGDWSKVGKIVPLEALPEEYGGSAGPMKAHEDAFLEEMLALNEHLLDDSKYRYNTKI